MSDGEGLGSTFFIQLPLYARKVSPPVNEDNRRHSLYSKSKRSNRRVLTKSKNSIRAAESSGKTYGPPLSTFSRRGSAGRLSINESLRSSVSILNMRNIPNSFRNIPLQHMREEFEEEGRGREGGEEGRERGGGESGLESTIDEDAVVSVVFPSLRDAVFGLSKRDRDRVKERGRDRCRVIDNDNDGDGDGDGNGNGEKKGEEKTNIIEIDKRWENSDTSLSRQTSFLGQRLRTDEYVHND